MSDTTNRPGKAYWVIHAKVNHEMAFDAYRKKNQEVFARLAHRYLVRGGRQLVKEGAVAGRTVIIEFPSMDAAIAAYESTGYQAARELRQQIIHGTPVAEVDFAIVEGILGASPP